MSWMNGEEYDFPVKTVEEIKLSGSENKEVGEECNKPEVIHYLQDMGVIVLNNVFLLKYLGRSKKDISSPSILLTRIGSDLEQWFEF